jgi:hypothetical protein
MDQSASAGRRADSDDESEEDSKSGAAAVASTPLQSVQDLLPKYHFERKTEEGEYGIDSSIVVTGLERADYEQARRDFQAVLKTLQKKHNIFKVSLMDDGPTGTKPLGFKFKVINIHTADRIIMNALSQPSWMGFKRWQVWLFVTVVVILVLLYVLPIFVPSVLDYSYIGWMFKLFHGQSNTEESDASSTSSLNASSTSLLSGINPISLFKGSKPPVLEEAAENDEVDVEGSIPSSAGSTTSTDVVSTSTDVVSTSTDVVSTSTDDVSTSTDVVSTPTDDVSTSSIHF